MTDANLLIPAAQYVRRSTEHQQYSLENQSLAIETYAVSHGFKVVLTYFDAKTGLVFRHRAGLRQMLQDVVAGTSGYKAILVYDVSRWGRFQDTDESAHYEFLCKSTGVPVHYCAETFANDNALPSLIMKALKRTMAGEYSRELGVKVLAGQKRLAGLGFKQGGMPGYGLRRMLVSASGTLKQELAAGERKSIATDRVILIPGPVHEVQGVKDIYRMLVSEKRSVYSIARELNRRGVGYTGTSKWDYSAVYAVLTNPKYIGCHVFGRTSRKLYTPTVRLPESEWIRTPKAFAPVVDEATFQDAQRLLLERTINKSDEELLAALRALLARQGRLSLRLIAEIPEMPSPSCYRGRFGSLRRAYQLVGYGCPEDFGPIDLRRRTQALREELIGKIEMMFPDKVWVERRGGRWRSLLRLETGPIVSIVIAHSIGTSGAGRIWQIDPIAHERLHISLLALLDGDNSIVQEMFLFLSMDRQRRFRVTRGHVWLKRGLPLESTSQFLEVVQTISESRTN